MLNLISDPWIPVLYKDGSRAVIAPWQMADAALAFPDWPRPDLNIACLELLIGLVFLADPPRDAADWRARVAPDPARLRAALAPFAPAFELMGDGPRFMQDMEAFEVGVRDHLSPDFLFIDSFAGSPSQNSDLFVKCARYPEISLPIAAMALYLLQNHAPAGGRGHRTSMRGGGPLVTMVDPGQGLWPLVWANVPNGTAGAPTDLPWTKDARTSEREGSEVTCESAHPVEAFFGVPRRIRLLESDGKIVGVAQRVYGANYSGWLHPLSPHTRKSATELYRAQRTRAGVYSYRNWVGTILSKARDTEGNQMRARMLDLWGQRSQQHADVIVAGWATKSGQFKILDFLFSRAPLLDLPDDQADRLDGMLEAAEGLGAALRGALVPVLAKGEALDAAREGFYLRTQAAFEARAAALANPGTPAGWLADLRGVALGMFDALALPGLAERDTKLQAEIVQARRNLTSAFAGYGKLGQGAYRALGLAAPEKKGKAA